jgi:hypothetical protein
MKFSVNRYIIDKDYELRLRDRTALFAAETKTRKTPVVTFVTTYGVMPGKHAGIAESEVVLDLGRLKPEHVGVEILFTTQDAKGALHIQEIRELDMVQYEHGIAKYVTEVLPEHTGMYQVAKRIFPKNPSLPHRQDFELVKWL